MTTLLHVPSMVLYSALYKLGNYPEVPREQTNNDVLTDDSMTFVHTRTPAHVIS